MTRGQTYINFDVSGIPKGQPRPRAFSRGGHVRVYDPGTAENWKSRIAMAAEAHKGLQLDKPLAITMRFRFPRPKSHFSPSGDLRLSAPVYYTGKPDFDNLEKAVADCLTQLGLWRDDALICENHGSYRYVSPGESPGCRIIICDPA
jgi:Holliday junction resolvase RusA-like endonuclease